MEEQRKIGGYGNIRSQDGKPFSKDHQPANPGRKPTKYLTEALRKALDNEGETLVTGIDVETGKKATVKVKLPGFQVLIMNMIQGAIKAASKGDVRGAKEIFDRLEGKVKEAIELTGEDGGPIEVKEIKRTLVFKNYGKEDKTVTDAEEVEDED